MALTFVSTATASVGTPIHVTVYSNGVAVDPSTNAVTWSGLPTSISVISDATGYIFNATSVVVTTVSAHDGVALGNLTLSFTAPPLQFTNP